MNIDNNFITWATNYFAPNKLNVLLLRKEVYNDYCKVHDYKPTPQLFHIKLTQFCKHKNYELNPVELQQKDGRILKHTYFTQNNIKKRITTEMYYINGKTKQININSTFKNNEKEIIATEIVDLVLSIKDKKLAVKLIQKCYL